MKDELWSGWWGGDLMVQMVGGAHEGMLRGERRGAEQGDGVSGILRSFMAVS